MANVDWKSLEGKYFRLDVGSTKEEALSATDNSVLHICTDGAIVMNGEVVAEKAEDNYVRIFEGLGVSNHLIFGSGQGDITFVDGELKDGMWNDDSASNSIKAKYLIGYDGDKKTLSLNAFDEKGQDIANSLNLGYLDNEMIGGNAGFDAWGFGSTSENTFIYAPKLYAAQQISHNINLMGELPNTPTGDLLELNYIGDGYHFGYINTYCQEKVNTLKEFKEKASMAVQSNANLDLGANNNVCIHGSNSISIQAENGSVDIQGTIKSGKAQFKGDSLEKRTTSIDCEGLHFVDTKFGGYEMLKSDTTDSFALIGLDKDGESLGYNAFYASLALSSDGKSVDTSSGVTSFRLMNGTLIAYGNGNVNVSKGLTVGAGLTVNSDYIKLSNNGYSAWLYNPSDDYLYLMLSDKNGTSWNDMRPFTINKTNGWISLASGALTMVNKGDVTVANNLTAKTVTQTTTSDIRAKENINYDFDAIAKLAGLGEVCEYDYKDGGKHSYGLIAQTLEKNEEFKDMVGVKTSVDDQGNEVEDADGMRYVNYLDARLVPLLIKSVQQLSDKVNALEKEIAELKK